MLQKHLRRVSAVRLSLIVLLICFDRESYSQTFSSGSTGAEGALNLTTPGAIIFDPVALGLHPAVENVFNFTTINIGAGVTVKLTSKVLTGPIYWLATGNVTIAGTIDASGENGLAPIPITNQSLRVPAAAGAGGYGGGVGGAPSVPAEPGNGPGGGAAPASAGGQRGTFTGSQYLIPLVGGSGGSGAVSIASNARFGGGGGGGGGAILIASSTSINFTVPGSILAMGGDGGIAVGCNSPCGGDGGGGGSGGAVRLIAPLLTAQGYCGFACPPGTTGGIRVHGGSAQYTGVVGSAGLIRLESFNPGILAGSLSFIETNIVSTPFLPVVPQTASGSLKVMSLVASGVTIPINANPFTFPDATINSPTPVTVNVQAQFIPTGTVPKIIVMSETGPDQTVNCSALAGTLQQSTCSAQIPFPTGGSRGFVKATW